MTAYYNEIDPFCCQWLGELMADNLITPGQIDPKDIRDVVPNDPRGCSQWHLFAGIGIWSAALRAAGWPDDREVLTVSCPCQPFSIAGKGKGTADERHLWPAAFHVISQLRPAVIFGEQVASKDGLAWFDLVRADLEAAGYTVGVVDTCAAGVGAPHIRQRLYFTGLAYSNGAESKQLARAGTRSNQASGTGPCCQPDGRCDPGGVACADSQGLRGSLQEPGQGSGPRARATHERVEGLCAPGGLALPVLTGRAEGRAFTGNGQAAGSGESERLGDAVGEPRERGAGGISGTQAEVGRAGIVNGDCTERPEHAGAGVATMPGPTNGLWAACDWLYCRDGKWRPVRPGSFPLADAGTYRNRVAELRGAGNALCLAQAQNFIEVVMEWLDTPNR